MRGGFFRSNNGTVFSDAGDRAANRSRLPPERA